MGLFDNIFGSSTGQTSSSKIEWNLLQNQEQIDELQSRSHNKPAVIFKHSTRCSISRMALKQFESAFDLEHEVTPYFLDLIENRQISNAVAAQFNVQHQSPQVLLIKNGNCIYNASHSDIDVQSLRGLI